MRNLLLITVAALAFTAQAHARSGSSVYGTFACSGTLTSMAPGAYDIVATDADGINTICELDEPSKLSTKRILSVCRDGHLCAVKAVGWIGSGNRRLIDKVLSVKEVES